jgi:hypothetical protein
MLLPGCPRQEKKLALRASPHQSLLHDGPSLASRPTDLAHKCSDFFKHVVAPSILYIYV